MLEEEEGNIFELITEETYLENKWLEERKEN